MKCRVSGKETVEVFNLGELQISDFTPDGEDSPERSGELKMMLCVDSGLLQLETTISPEKMYGKYWYSIHNCILINKVLMDTESHVNIGFFKFSANHCNSQIC